MTGNHENVIALMLASMLGYGIAHDLARAAVSRAVSRLRHGCDQAARSVAGGSPIFSVLSIATKGRHPSHANKSMDVKAFRRHRHSTQRNALRSSATPSFSYHRPCEIMIRSGCQDSIC